MLALISQVITFTDGLCVATIKCIHIALAFWAILVIEFSTSFLFHDIIISASSSITTTIRYIFSQMIFALYSSRFFTLFSLSNPYLLSISFTHRFKSLSALSESVTIGARRYGIPE